MTAKSIAKKDSSLLFAYRSEDSASGVTRDTAKRLSALMGVTETGLLHIALARLAQEKLPMYEQDNGPLTSEQRLAIQKVADADFAKKDYGPLIEKRSLF